MQSPIQDRFPVEVVGLCLVHHLCNSFVVVVVIVAASSLPFQVHGTRLFDRLQPVDLAYIVVLAGFSQVGPVMVDQTPALSEGRTERAIVDLLARLWVGIDLWRHHQVLLVRCETWRLLGRKLGSDGMFKSFELMVGRWAWSWWTR